MPHPPHPACLRALAVRREMRSRVSTTIERSTHKLSDFSAIAARGCIVVMIYISASLASS
jgi:hypothetical protein